MGFVFHPYLGTYSSEVSISLVLKVESANLKRIFLNICEVNCLVKIDKFCSIINSGKKKYNKLIRMDFIFKYRLIV